MLLVLFVVAVAANCQQTLSAPASSPGPPAWRRAAAPVKPCAFVFETSEEESWVTVQKRAGWLPQFNYVNITSIYLKSTTSTVQATSAYGTTYVGIPWAMVHSRNTPLQLQRSPGSNTCIPCAYREKMLKNSKYKYLQIVCAQLDDTDWVRMPQRQQCEGLDHFLNDRSRYVVPPR